MDEQTYINEHTDDLLAELIDFLRIPSISSLSEHREDVRRAANWVAEKLQGICGPTVEVIDDPEKLHMQSGARRYLGPDLPDWMRERIVHSGRVVLRIHPRRVRPWNITPPP